MTARAFIPAKFPGRLHRRSLLCTLILSIIAALALGMARPRPALAAPDPPVYTGLNSATFSGDQSLGIWTGRDFVIPPVTDYTVEVNNLTKNITPVLDPSYPSVYPSGITMINEGAGVNDDGNGFPGCNLTLDYDGGSHSIKTQDRNASGIDISSAGHYGDDGCTGGAGGSITVTSSGAI